MKSDNNNKLPDALCRKLILALPIGDAGFCANIRAMAHPSYKLQIFKRYILGSVLAGFVVLIAACGGGSSGDNEPPLVDTNVQGSIGPNGGTVVHDTGASVEIPAGALTTAVEIRISTDTTSAPTIPATLQANGNAYALLPHGTTFATPVTVSIPFDAALIPPGATPRLFKAEPGGSFGEIPANVVGDKLVAQVSSFSFFQALGDTPLVVGPLPVQEIVVTFGSGASGQCSIPEPCGVGNLQWTVPADVYTATFELYGAPGNGLEGVGKGRGLGGKTTATLDVYPGEVLDVAFNSDGGSGGYGGLWTLYGTHEGSNDDPFDYFFSHGSRGGGSTDVVRGVRGVPKGWPGAHGRILVAGGGGGDAGVTVNHVDSDGSIGELTSSNSWAIKAPGAPGGQGGGLVAGTGGSGQAWASESLSAASGGTGGSTLAPGQAGASSLASLYDPPQPCGLAADGNLLWGGGHGGDCTSGDQVVGSMGGVGGGGGGGGWMPGGGGGSSISPYHDAAGGGGGSSYGPDGSVFLQGVNSGGGKVVITFTPSPGRLPTTTTVATSGTPSSAGQAVTFTATVTLKPPAIGPVTGSVRFEVEGMLLGEGPVVLVDGQATSDATTTLAPGLHSVVVIYLGSGNVAPSSATLSQLVSP
jgi:hypothetical protein